MEGFTEKDQERIYNEAKEAAQVGKSHRGLGYHPEQDHVETKFKHASHADYQHDAFTEKDQMRIYKEAKIAAKDADQHLGLGYHHHHISKKLDHQGAYVHDDHGFTEDDQARIYKEISDAAEQNRNHRGIGYTAEKEKFEAKFVHSSDSKDERESQHKDPKAIASSIAAKLKKPKGETSTSGIANKRSGEEEKSHSHHKKHHHDHQSEHRNERRSDGKAQSATSWMREDLNHSGTLEFQSLDEGIYQMEAGHRKDLQKLIEDEEVENLAEKDTDHHGPSKADIAHANAIFGTAHGHVPTQQKHTGPSKSQDVEEHQEKEASEVVNENLLHMSAEQRKLAWKKKIHEMRREQQDD